MYYVTTMLWRLIMAPRLRIKVSGKENIPTKGPFIVVSRHTSIYDPWIIIDALNFGKRPIRWLAGLGLYSIEISARKFARGKSRPIAFCVGFAVSFIVKYSLTIPVEREEDGGKRFSTVNKHAFKTIRTILTSSDGVVGIFPEGGINREGNIHSSFINIAQMYNVPILPVRIEGKEVVFGKAIMPDKNLVGHERIVEAHKIIGRTYKKM